MMKWILGGVVVAMFAFVCATETPAQETLKSGGTTVQKSEQAPAPMMRRGLLSRLTERRGLFRRTATTTTPTKSTTPPTTTPTTPTTPPATTTTTSTVSMRTGLLSRLRGRLAR